LRLAALCPLRFCGEILSQEVYINVAKNLSAGCLDRCGCGVSAGFGGNPGAPASARGDRAGNDSRDRLCGSPNPFDSRKWTVKPAFLGDPGETWEGVWFGYYDFTAQITDSGR
jgi:hypothetical protein